MCQQQHNTIHKTKHEYQAPQGAPQAIAKQLLVTNDVVSYHEEVKHSDDGHLLEKEPKRHRQQEEGHLQTRKKDLDKEPLGLRVPRVARRVAEHDPGGENDSERQYQHGPTEMRLIPVVKRLGHVGYVFPSLSVKPSSW